MSESSRLGKARGRLLPVAIAAAALVAMLALAPLAAAATPDPVASGTTKLTINKGFKKQTRKAGLKISALKPTKLKGVQATLKVRGGEVEAARGVGTITHRGGLKLRWGKKSVALRNVEVNTRNKSLYAKVGGKKVRLAKLVRVKATRLGFGNRIATKKVKLTGSGAKALNRKLTPKPRRTKVRRRGRTVVKVVRTKPLFKANRVIGKTVTRIQPETVNVLPAGTMTYNGDEGLLKRLEDVGVKIETISPTTRNGFSFASGISGGTISPLGTSGQINSGGGLKLVQNLPQGPSTTITLASIGVDLAAKTAGVEVIGESTAEAEGKKPLNLGNLGRSSIADLTINSVISSPATRAVGVNAAATIQVVAAEVLEGFVKVYQGYYAQVAALTLQKEIEAGLKPPMSEAEIKAAGAKAAEAKVANDHIKAGESLGTFSFTATGE